ncbi:unnamed protein product, partial [Ectocarpus sp. 13 AM-2016]
VSPPGDHIRPCQCAGRGLGGVVDCPGPCAPFTVGSTDRQHALVDILLRRSVHFAGPPCYRHVQPFSSAALGKIPQDGSRHGQGLAGRLPSCRGRRVDICTTCRTGKGRMRHGHND